MARTEEAVLSPVRLSDEREFANVLYYGDGGTGKTTDLASLARLGRVLYVDAEAGLKSKPLKRLGIPIDNIERLPLNTDAFEVMEQAFLSMKDDLDTDPNSWVGMVIDSMTEAYHALLDGLVSSRVTKAERLIRTGRNVSEIMANRFFVDRDDYGTMSEQVRFLLRRFRDLPCHFGTAFLERRDQDERTREVKIGPSITPGLQADVIGWHDVVCRTSFDQDLGDEGLYVGVFRPEGVRQGKDRFGVLPRRLIDPTFDRIVAYINEELTEADDERQRALEGEEEDQAELVTETLGEGDDDAEDGGLPQPIRRATTPARKATKAARPSAASKRRG